MHSPSVTWAGAVPFGATPALSCGFDVKAQLVECGIASSPRDPGLESVTPGLGWDLRLSEVRRRVSQIRSPSDDEGRPRFAKLSFAGHRFAVGVSPSPDVGLPFCRRSTEAVTSLDRTPGGTETSVRGYVWATVVTTLATLATVLALAFTGNDEAAVAVAAAGFAGSAVGAVQITVHVRR